MERTKLQAYLVGHRIPGAQDLPLQMYFPVVYKVPTVPTVSQMAQNPAFQISHFCSVLLLMNVYNT